ncbi:glycosyltransferase family 4 protein, partial [Actinomyces sp.]|uniref:glycosyltransferase family 4 protein n=1 Tax=Actinomyces sp. TaxID=29317 RepID=UPI0028A06FEC
LGGEHRADRHPGGGRPEQEPPRHAPRILHVLTNSRPWTQSGYALRSHAVLRAQRSAGLDVRAVTRLAYPVTIGRPQAGPTDRVEDITYHRLLPRRLPRLPDRRLLLHARMLADLVQRERPDLLHTTTNFHNALVTDAVSRALGIPWVYEMRGELEKSWVARRPRDEQEAAAHSTRYALMRARETEMAKRADAVVVLSRVQRDSMVERGVDPSRIRIVPNAVDEALLDLPVDREGARRELGLADGFRVGTVSALVDYEGLDTLVRALAELRGRGLEVHASIVGDGVSREDLIRLTQELGLSDLVDFPGKVAPERAVDWYRALDVMVIPRRETPVTRAVTPIKGLQAMALGIPQVVSDLPALTEVASDDGQGLAVPAEDVDALADALQRLAEDPALRERMSRAARKAARERTWEANGRVYRELYGSLLGLS